MSDSKIANEKNKKQFMFKLALIGDPAVGKTSIRKRYLGEGFQKEHLTTLGADFAVTTKHIGDYIIKFQIWDLAGQSHFKNVRPKFFRGCFGALAVFDLTRRDTFFNLPSWLEDLYAHNGRGVIPVIVLANKYDLEEQKKITLKETEEFVKELNKKTEKNAIKNFYLETSAKTGLNIDEAFKILAEYVINRFG